MLVYFAVILTVLLGFCGLAVDTGRVELRTLQLQAAADAGAVGAATELQRGSASWSNAASYDVASFRSLNNIPAVSLAVQQTSSTAPYLADYSTVQVSVQQTVPTIFMGLISSGTSSAKVSVKGVAEIPPCAYFFGTPNNASTTAAVQLASAGMNPSCPIYSGS